MRSVRMPPGLLPGNRIHPVWMPDWTHHKHKHGQIRHLLTKLIRLSSTVFPFLIKRLSLCGSMPRLQRAVRTCAQLSELCCSSIHGRTESSVTFLMFGEPGQCKICCRFRLAVFFVIWCQGSQCHGSDIYIHLPGTR